MTIPRPAIDRLLVKTAAGPDGCIIWTGCIDPKTGYGQFSVDKGTTTTAHRAAYRLLVGEVPGGLHLDHACHTRDRSCPGGPRDCLHRRCVNHLHLEAVTPATNNLRSDRIVSTRNAAKTHCIRGHEFTPGNTVWRTNPSGKRGRRCLTCRTEWDRNRSSKAA